MHGSLSKRYVSFGNCNVFSFGVRRPAACSEERGNAATKPRSAHIFPFT